MSGALQADSLVLVRDDEHAAVWRVVCADHRSATHVLALSPISPDGETEVTPADIRALRLVTRRLPFDDVEAGFDGGELVAVDQRLPEILAQPLDALSAQARDIARSRIAIMKPFLDAESLMENFRVASDFGVLVREALANSQRSDNDLKVGRPSIYRWLKTLITYGFQSGSLHPRHDRNGAPGRRRVYGEGTDRKKPGRRPEVARLGLSSGEPRGLTDQEQKRIVTFAKAAIRKGRSYRRAYNELLYQFYSENALLDSTGKLSVVLLPPEKRPTFEQFRYLIKREIKRLDRVKSRTTPTHFVRNKRGLHGSARDGVLGPGHVYAIDSTVGDIYLRSGFDRSLLVGRPIVYWVIDVWSTAIVGFYVCLGAPAWRYAKAALYCTAADPGRLSTLLGFEFPIVLDPAPTLPAKLLCDRGEYLSQGATVTASGLGYSVEYNPSYRPDLRGSGERFHRIAKDEQHRFVPGAFDARREELELRPNTTAATLTLSEYSEYLAYVAAEHNECADREYLLTAEQAAARVPATPAGLWRWGHKVGRGFQKRTAPDRLVRACLYETPLTVKAKGVYCERMRYLLPQDCGELAAEARSIGVLEVPGYVLPTVAGHLFADLPNVEGLSLLEQAPMEMVGESQSFFDYADAESQRRINRGEKRQSIDEARVGYLHQKRKIVAAATEKTAVVGDSKPSLSVPEARRYEISGHKEGTPSEGTVEGESPGQNPSRIGTLIDDLFRGMS